MVMKQTQEVSSGNKLYEMIEAFPTNVVENTPSPRVLNTHLKVKYLPKVNYIYNRPCRSI